MRKHLLAALCIAAVSIPAPAGADPYKVTVDLTLKKHLKAIVKLDFTDPPFPINCLSYRKVIVQKKKAGNWKKVGSKETNNNGRAVINIPDLPGRYRARAPAKGTCAVATSKVLKHTH